MGVVVFGILIGLVVLVAARMLWLRRVEGVRHLREFRHDASRLVALVESIGPGLAGKPGEARDEAWMTNAIQAGVLIDQLVGDSKKLREGQRARVTGVLEDLQARWAAAVPDVMRRGGALPEAEFVMITTGASRVAEALRDERGGRRSGRRVLPEP